MAKLAVARKAISHPGEKGRFLEDEVTKLVRSFLPSEYGLSTGFIAYHEENDVKLSKQLDIIIYDALRTGPIVRLSTCDIFPIEAVYGYIEVKASLQSSSNQAEKYADNSIETCILDNQKLRGMQQRRFYKPREGSTNIADKIITNDWMPIRSYIFSFEANGSVATDPQQMAKRISEFSKKTERVHLHGVFVGGSAYYKTSAIDPRVAKPEDYYHVHYTQTHPLAAFKWSLLHSLSRFPKHPDNWTPAIDDYSEGESTWLKYPE